MKRPLHHIITDPDAVEWLQELTRENEQLRSALAAAQRERDEITNKAERLYKWHAVADLRDYGLHNPGCCICDLVRAARAGRS